MANNSNTFNNGSDAYNSTIVTRSELDKALSALGKVVNLPIIVVNNPDSGKTTVGVSGGTTSINSNAVFGKNPFYEGEYLLYNVLTSRLAELRKTVALGIDVNAELARVAAAEQVVQNSMPPFRQIVDEIANKVNQQLLDDPSFDGLSIGEEGAPSAPTVNIKNAIAQKIVIELEKGNTTLQKISADPALITKEVAKDYVDVVRKEPIWEGAEPDAYGHYLSEAWQEFKNIFTSGTGDGNSSPSKAAGSIPEGSHSPVIDTGTQVPAVNSGTQVPGTNTDSQIPAGDVGTQIPTAGPIAKPEWSQGFKSDPNVGWTTDAANAGSVYVPLYQEFLQGFDSEAKYKGSFGEIAVFEGGNIEARVNAEGRIEIFNKTTKVLIGVSNPNLNNVVAGAIGGSATLVIPSKYDGALFANEAARAKTYAKLGITNIDDYWVQRDIAVKTLLPGAVLTGFDHATGQYIYTNAEGELRMTFDGAYRKDLSKSGVKGVETGWKNLTKNLLASDGDSANFNFVKAFQDALSGPTITFDTGHQIIPGEDFVQYLKDKAQGNATASEPKAPVTTPEPAVPTKGGNPQNSANWGGSLEVNPNADASINVPIKQKNIFVPLVLDVLDGLGTIYSVTKYGDVTVVIGAGYEARFNSQGDLKVFGRDGAPIAVDIFQWNTSRGNFIQGLDLTVPSEYDVFFLGKNERKNAYANLGITDPDAYWAKRNAAVDDLLPGGKLVGYDYKKEAWIYNDKQGNVLSLNINGEFTLTVDEFSGKLGNLNLSDLPIGGKSSLPEFRELAVPSSDITGRIPEIAKPFEDIKMPDRGVKNGNAGDLDVSIGSNGSSGPSKIVWDDLSENVKAAAFAEFFKQKGEAAAKKAVDIVNDTSRSAESRLYDLKSSLETLKEVSAEAEYSLGHGASDLLKDALPEYFAPFFNDIDNIDDVLNPDLIDVKISDSSQPDNPNKASEPKSSKGFSVNATARLMAIMQAVDFIKLAADEDRGVAALAAGAVDLASTVAGLVDLQMKIKSPETASTKWGVASDALGLASSAVFLGMIASDFETIKKEKGEAVAALMMATASVNTARAAASLVQSGIQLYGSTSQFALTAGKAAGSAATGLMGVGTALSFAMGVMNALQQEETGGKIAAGVETGVQVVAGIALMLQMTGVISLSAGPIGLAVAAMMSSPFSAFMASKYDDIANQYLDKYHQTGWEGDKLNADRYGFMRTTAIIGAIPVAGLLYSFGDALVSLFGVDTETRLRKEMNKDIISQYIEKLRNNGVSNASANSSKDVYNAISLYWEEGLDSRQKLETVGYMARLEEIKNSGKYTRVVGFATQLLDGDMLQSGAYVGFDVAKYMKSGKNYGYSTDGTSIGTANNILNVESSAETQYVTFLTPFMAFNEEKRGKMTKGKDTHYITFPRWTPITVNDGKSSTTIDVRNFASRAPITGTVKLQDVLNMGGGNDHVIAGARAIKVDGGTELDAVDYRSALKSTLAGNKGFDIIGSNNQYEVTKRGVADFYQVETRTREEKVGKNKYNYVQYETTVFYGSRQFDGQTDTIINVETIFGSIGNDTFRGLNTVDQFFGYDGDDLIYGNGGNDIIDGGAGNDTLNGGDGDDTIWGGAGNDRIYGDLGNDTLMGDEGADYINGGLGDDIIGGGDGNDELWGADGNDQLIGHFGDDKLYGGNGNDQLWGEVGNDYLDGGNGDDLLNGGEGADQLFGGAGDDILIGGASVGQKDNKGKQISDGNDTLDGGAGNDILVGGLGNDKLIGGAGDDILYDDSGINTMFGGDGNDILVVTEGAFGSSLDGGAGQDIVSFRYSAKAVTAILSENKPTGGASVIALTAIEHVEGSEKDDKIYGDGGNNFLYGRGGNDIIQGNAGNDVLFGDQGDDILIGGVGNDVLFGGTGQNTLNGGAGADMFILGAAGGSDTIVMNQAADLVGDLFFWGQSDYRDLFFMRDEDDLAITVLPGGNSAYAGRGSTVIQDFFSFETRDEAAFVARSGGSAMVLVGSQIQALVSAMAMNVSGGTLSANYRDNIRPVQEAAWALMTTGQA